jgi:flagellar protein FlaJ
LSKSTEVKKTNVEAPKPSIIHLEKIRVGIGSAVASAIVFILSFYLSEFSETTGTRDVGIIFAILVGIVPLTLLQLREVQRRDSIDRNLPLFLLALVSAVQSGSNLIRAIEQTADRNMGSLTPELKNLRANITWGMPIEDAFENFAQRTGTRMAKRVVILLEMAIKIGGDITSNLEMIQKYVTELQNLEKERKSNLQPYTYTIYISYVVFIGIAVILSSQFFSEIQVVQDLLKDTATGSSGGVFSALKDMDLKQLDSILFNMAIVEAVFGGLAAGKIGSGSYVAGIKHIVVMVVIAIIAFNVM